jgi:hypothetical protein
VEQNFPVYVRNVTVSPQLGNKKMKNVVLLAALASGATLMSTQEAQASLDPGTGSMLLQGLIAGLAATSVVIGRYWYKVKSYFVRTTDRTARGKAPDATRR